MNLAYCEGGASFVNICYLCFVSVMLSCLFIVALWSPAGKGLLVHFYVKFSCVFLTYYVVSWVRCAN